jgi:hypothetical protein
MKHCPADFKNGSGGGALIAKGWAAIRPPHQTYEE